MPYSDSCDKELSDFEDDENRSVEKIYSCQMRRTQKNKC